MTLRYTRNESGEDRGLPGPSERPQRALGGVAVEGKELDVRRRCRRLSPEADSELAEALGDLFVGFLKAQSKNDCPASSGRESQLSSALI